jgi:hypothetical protein
MNYFQAYLPSLDQSIVAAWDSQVAGAAETPWLAQALATKSAELFPRFASAYAELRALPRGVRRNLQRQLARSGEAAAIFPASLQQKLARSVAGAALLIALGQGSALANQITLTTTNPRVNADTLCSLIEALQNANDATTGQPNTDCPAGDPAGADEIVLQASSVHTLTKVNNSVPYGATGLPVITSAVTITGNGATIKRKLTKTPGFRIFAVVNTGDLTLDNVTVSGGRKLSIKGGGIANYGGTVTVTNSSTISGNRAQYGGGLYSSDGVLTITGSTITGNKAGSGGGVHTYNGTLTITNSTISNNTASAGIGPGYADGGGVFSKAVAASYPTSIVGSTITGNRARFGGGVYARNTGVGSEVTIDGGTISYNTATLSGGGIYHYAGSVAITNSHVITDNKSVKHGGGIYNKSGELSIANSTVSNNTATGRAISGGGGIYNYVNADLIITNATTISGNRSRFGGGVFNSGYFYIDSSTITTNTAIVVGGGVYNYNRALNTYTFVNTNSTITGNTPDDIVSGP